MPTILVLAAGHLQVPAITCAKNMGLRVVAADGSADAPGLSMADVPCVVNVLDADACLEVARREKIDGVVHICSEVAMYSMGRINDELGLHGVGSATAVISTNKEKMRRAFEAGGAPSPKSIGVITSDEAIAAAKQIGSSMIIKPSRNSGSRGVTRLDKPSRKKLLAALEYAVSESRDNSAVMEEFVEGPEFSVELLTWNGQPHVLAVTDKETTGPPHFVEMGHSQPTRFSQTDRQIIEEAAIKGVKALGIDWAAAHAEIKLSPRGPYIIEIGARMGGDCITTELVPRSTGINMMEGTINLAMGREPDLKPKHAPRGAAIRFLRAEPGRVVAIEGVKRAERIPGVKIVWLRGSTGSIVGKITSSKSRFGYIIAEGSTADKAVANAEAGRNAIRVVTESE